jgi:hypothetical protein
MIGGEPEAAGVWAGTADHDIPFHWFANTELLPPTTARPSVSQVVGETQETE